MECVICLDDIFAESASCIPCGHVYHTKCIKPWLKAKRTCPLCNKFFKKSNLIRLYLCNGGPAYKNNNDEESSDEDEVPDNIPHPAPVPPLDPIPGTSRGNQRSPMRVQRWTYLVRQRQRHPYFHGSGYSPLPTIPTPDFDVANYLMTEPSSISIPQRPSHNEPRASYSNPTPQRPTHSSAYGPIDPPPANPRPSLNEDFARDGNRIQFSASLSFPTSSSGNGSIPREYSIRFDTEPSSDRNRAIPETYPTWRNYQQPPPPRPTRIMNDWDVFPQVSSYSGNIPQNLHQASSIIHPNGQQRGQHVQHQGAPNIHQAGNIHHQNNQNIHQPGTSSQNANLLHQNNNQSNVYQGGQFDVNNHGQMQNPHQRR